MEKLLFVPVVLSLSVACGRLGVAGPSPCATENGDVNGDGSLDLSDAIYSLAFLFQGGPAPVPICQGAEPETDCDDDMDNDLDGATDCADSDCDTDPMCESFTALGMNPIGEQNDKSLTVRINPQRGTRESRVTKRSNRKKITARSAKG